MRDPSLHITKKTLKVILLQLEDQGIDLSVDINYLVNFIIKKGKKYSVDNRGILVSSEMIEKKVKKQLRSSNSDASKMALLILNIRRSMKHRGLKLIKEGDRDWTNVKSMASDAINFCNEFEIQSKDEGFKSYLKIGLSKMVKFNITRFPSMYESICLSYQSQLDLQDDDTPTKTKEIHDYYISTVGKRTGVMDSYENNIDKYKYFFMVKQVCEDNKFPYKIWIDAQFHGFEWNQILPDPMQLVGDKALKRFNKYIYHKKIRFDKIPKKKMDFKKILNA